MLISSAPVHSIGGPTGQLEIFCYRKNRQIDGRRVLAAVAARVRPAEAGVQLQAGTQKKGSTRDGARNVSATIGHLERSATWNDPWTGFGPGIRLTGPPTGASRARVDA